MEVRSWNSAFRQLLLKLERFAPIDSAFVLLEGETGTGKNFLARYLHARSRRSGAPFREANLASVDDALASSELFGHVRGAFTDAKLRRAGHFAMAHGSTLFLDELGKASIAVQKKLLRVVETGECWPIGAERPVPVDVRLVGASNVSLDQLVDDGEFLPDLRARLGCFRIYIPPLRDRPEDIPWMITESVRRQAPLAGYASPPTISGQLLCTLVAYHWPYNVRELEATVLRLLVDAEGASVLRAELCTEDLGYLLASEKSDDRLSKELVRETVRTEGSMVAAANRLGVHRSTLYRVLRTADATN